MTLPRCAFLTFERRDPSGSGPLLQAGKFPMDVRIPPLNIKILLGSTPLRSRILVWRLAAAREILA